MSDLIAFIEARLAEDEAVARAAGAGSWHAEFNARRVEGHDITIYDEGGHDEHQAEHIARHDPVRVLFEVEAKRRIIKEHAPREMFVRRGDGYDYPGFYCGCCSPTDPNRRQRYPCLTVRSLAAVWATHPDYRAEWAA